MGNKIILISSYCDNEEKISVLESNIRTLKNLGLDVMLNSPIDIPNRVSSLCDYYIRTKDNPIIDWPIKSVSVWSEYRCDGKKIIMNRCLPDYGWANIHQVKKLSEYALTYDYEYFYHIIYDIKIDDTVLSCILSDVECNFYHFHEHWVSLHFMLFNRKNLVSFISGLNINEYIEFCGIAETWLKNYLENSDLPYKVDDCYVDDHILFHNGVDLFNYSGFSEFRYFIAKNAMENNSIKIYFYGVKNHIDLKIHLNSTTKIYEISDRDIIDLELSRDDMISVIIEYNGLIEDITEKIRSITHNNINLYEEN
jgi:hypothetical protein